MGVELNVPPSPPITGLPSKCSRSVSTDANFPNPKQNSLPFQWTLKCFTAFFALGVVCVCVCMCICVCMCV